MTVRRYKTGLNRQQSSLLPERIEDYVDDSNPIRAIDAYVDSLDFQQLGFRYTTEGVTRGQPAYSPSALLKLYLYGYLNHVRSSRRLERETYRNLEVIWLMEKLQPSYKTIASFRAHNAKALKSANRDFVLLCQELDLFGQEVVGIDGSFFRADASKHSVHTSKKLKKQLKQLDKRINAYHQQLAHQDTQDDKAGKGSLVEDTDLKEKLAQLQEKQRDKQALLETLEASDDTQLSTTDEDARFLSKRGQSSVGYNVQIAVDDKHKLIVDSEVTNDGNDSQQLAPMAENVKKTLGVESLTVVADAGYFEGEQLKRCEAQGITPYVAIPDKSKAIKKQGRYTRADFHFDAKNNVYKCPLGQRLEPSGQLYQKRNKRFQRYVSKVTICNDCCQRKLCLMGDAKVRQLNRWEYEAVIECHRERMKDSGHWMRLRSTLVEHPFGTLKRRAGWDHFLVRGFKKVQGEWSLMALCYNMTRVLNTVGIEPFLEACAQRRKNNINQMVNTLFA